LTGKDVKSEEADHPTIFHDIINSDLPPQDKSLDRLTQEALSVVGAGMETTKWVLTVATYHLLDPENADILARLRTELKEPLPDANTVAAYRQLEQLPYLGAIVSEGWLATNIA
jgi:cytochrome P450